jgi:hypothetical protein
VIVDGLDGKFSSQDGYANAFLKALDNTKFGKMSDVIFCHLNSSLATARVRQAAIYGKISFLSEYREITDHFLYNISCG